MDFSLRSWRSIYQRWYTFLAKNRPQKGDFDPRRIHTHNAIIISTAPFMLGYAILAQQTIAHSAPALVGYVCSIIHLFSPLVIRFTASVFVMVLITAMPAVVHISTFSYFTGGFESHSLIWLGILPLFLGFTAGKKWSAFFAFLCAVIAGVFFYLRLQGHVFPNLISPDGHFVAHAFLIFGWMFMSVVIIVIMVSLHEANEKLLADQGRRIDELFRVLFHDLANPLGRLSIGLNISKKGECSEITRRGLEIASQASDSMLEITQSVRKMYAVSKGKADIDLRPLPICEAVDHIRSVFSSELDRKRVRIHYVDEQKYSVLVDPISFKNQVFANVISNAIKFSPVDGTISIRCQKLNDGFVVVDITDQGIGMPETIVENLFDLTKKTTRPGTLGEIGTGFGMSIMKSFVEMYQGKVSITSKERSEENEGFTTVRLWLKGK